jgi:hypothetical protein
MHRSRRARTDRIVGANGSESQLDGYEVVSFVWTGLQTHPGER